MSYEDGFSTLGGELAALAPALEPKAAQRFVVVRTSRTEDRAPIGLLSSHGITSAASGAERASR